MPVETPVASWNVVMKPEGIFVLFFPPLMDCAGLPHSLVY